jgi:EpsI family protein
MSTSAHSQLLPNTMGVAPRRLSHAMAAGLIAVAFWQTWMSFPPAWLAFREHGFVVALLCGWLLWRDRVQLAGDGRRMPLANLAVLGLSVLWLVGFVLNSQLVYQAAMPMLLLSWLLATAGWAAFRAALPVAGAFFFAIPVWGVLTRPLQTMTVVVNARLLDLAGIEAKIDGDFITIRDGVFWVADGCAGVNYFEIGLLVSVMYSLLFLRTWKARGVAMLTAVTLTVVSNWLRVFGLIVIGHNTHMQSSLIVNGHGTYGWIIFAATMLLFFLLVPRIDALDRQLASHHGAAGTASPPLPEDTGADRGAPRGRATDGLVLSTGLAVLGPVLLMGTSALPDSAPSSAFASGVSPSAEWVRQPPLPIADTTRSADVATQNLWRPAYAGADEHRRERWTRGAEDVQVDRLLYVEQSQGKELINSENHIAPDSLVAGDGLSAPLNGDGRRVRVAAVRTDAGVRLVWYWYHVAGRDTHSATDAKLRELLAFARRAPASELVAVSMLCTDEQCRAASRSLYTFVTGRTLRAP